MRKHKAQVIVLKVNYFSEADLIVRAMTNRGALISFIAKGARKSRRRFTGGVLEPGHFIGIEYHASKRASLHYLQQAWFLKRFNGLRENYDRLKIALYFLSVMEHISQEGMDSPELFHLLGNSLEAATDSEYLLALQFVFEFRVLCYQGVLPKEFQVEEKLLNTTIAEHEQLKEDPLLRDHATTIHTLIENYMHKTHTHFLSHDLKNF